MAYDVLLVAAMALRGEMAGYAELYFGVPPPLAIIAAQVAQESAFDPRAKSVVGAVGLLQFMPSTAKWAGTQIGPFDPTDAQGSLRAGIWYDRWLYQRVKYSTDCDRWGAALASYNGGLGWQYKRQAQAQNPTDFWNGVRLVNPGVSPASQRENETYPQRIVYLHQPRFAALGGRKVCP